MEIVKSAGCRLKTGRMAELDIRELFCRLLYVVFLTEAVGKNKLASLIRKIDGRIISSLILRCVPLYN